MNTTKELTYLVEKSPFKNEWELAQTFEDWREAQTEGDMNMFSEYPFYAGLSKQQTLFIVNNYDELNRLL